MLEELGRNGFWKRGKFCPQHKIDPSNAKKKAMWMTADARTSINIKKQQFSKYRKTRSILDYERYIVARNSVKWELKRAVREYERKLSREVKRNIGVL